MTDDLLSILITHNMRQASNGKVTLQPWMIKEWTTQKNYSYRLTTLITQSVESVRNGFMAIYEAIKGMKKDG